MPKRTDIQSILVLGSGPIVIGQACEFDYSGTQACRALRQEGYRVILVNSNPATIMTDPEVADATYIEPLQVDMVAKIIAKERPDALLPTVGGQTGINLTLQLEDLGIFEQYDLEVLGANLSALKLGEDRELFKVAMEEIGLKVIKSGVATRIAEARKVAEDLGFPLIIRPSFTLGGEGGGVAYNRAELDDVSRTALDASPVSQILLEQSVMGWKEFELEVIRDHRDNAIVVCSVENVDAMGVHTGDSITVAPQQTLSDRDYQAMREDAFRVIRKVGVATGGSNIQFGVNPLTGERVVIEMNPRVSRSSALASKATGYPIAKVAALLAVGYTLDEIPNEITGVTWAAFEPALDYTVVKIPRWAFEKFPATPTDLGTSMRSVGEVMALGGNFREALMKAIDSLELEITSAAREKRLEDPVRLRRRLAVPNWERMWAVFAALRQGWTIQELSAVTGINEWFLREIREIVIVETELSCWDLNSAPTDLLIRAREAGLSTERIAGKLDTPLDPVNRRLREVAPRVFKRVDTCAAEFPAETPYLYSTTGFEDEAEPSNRRKVMILGSGPNRIGQGIEFDYCCVHAALALSKAGYETIMVNCNPETVSTDYDTSDRLYFEPLTLEHVMEIVELEKPEGVIVQLGGQTPLSLSAGLEARGVPIWGTSPEAIDWAEDRERFGALLREEGILQPENGIALSVEEALEVAETIGYPIVVRPSYVLGGRAMAICWRERSLREYMAGATEVAPGRPVLLDRFLDDAFELDLDLICDGDKAVVCGILQHIEEAGIHSGDSSAVFPPYRVGEPYLGQMKDVAIRLAHRLGVVGLMNVQFAIHEGRLYVIEVNPRASRTVPFIAKAVGLPLAGLAARVMAGEKLDDLGLGVEPTVPGVFVKVPVFPFRRFPGEDPRLGPEMKSTGEVMGVGATFGEAFAKGWIAAGHDLPLSGKAFLSVHDRDKKNLLPVALKLRSLGFDLLATCGTAQFLRDQGLPVETVLKLHEGRPHIADRLLSREISLVVNTPLGPTSHREDGIIRQSALKAGVPCLTTLSGAMATVEGIEYWQKGELVPYAIQEVVVGPVT